MSDNWWQDDALVHFLVKIAQDFDRDYAGRPILCVGHSPSWLVYTVGKIREARLEEKNTHFIPFTGRNYELTPETMHGEDEIFFRPNQHHSVSDASLRGYFNYLSAHHVDPACFDQPTAAKPVIVDLVSHGNGIVSFLDAYGRYAYEQGYGDLEDYMDLVLFKMNFDKDEVSISFPSEKTADKVYHFHAKIISGHAGSLFNLMAGAQGVSVGDLGQDKNVGRFMPYYSIVDGYKETSYLARFSTPVSGLEKADNCEQDILRIKQSINAALTASDEVKTQCLTQAKKTLDKRAVKPLKNGWVPIYRGYH